MATVDFVTVFPWILTIVFGSISIYLAIYSLLVTRKPLIKIRNKRLWYVDDQIPKRIHSFSFDLFGYGGDVYGLRVVLEAHYKRTDDRTCVVDIELPPSTPVPEPFKNNQYVNYVIELEHILTKKQPTDRVLSDATGVTGIEAAYIVIYGAGGVSIKRVADRYLATWLMTVDNPPLQKVQWDTSSEWKWA